MVRWLGGQPSTHHERGTRGLPREGWWRETVNTPPSTLAYAPSDR